MLRESLFVLPHLSKEQEAVPKSTNIDDVGRTIPFYASNNLFGKCAQSARGLAQFTDVPFM